MSADHVADSLLSAPAVRHTAQPWPIVIAAAADPDRLRAISEYDLNSPELRDCLDLVTARTSAQLGLPTSLVTLVLDSAQLVAGSTGLRGWIRRAGGTPVEWSFCAHVVASGLPYTVEDAVHDAVQRENPLALLDGIASYAGVPVTLPSGHVAGAHCVIGSEPRSFTTADLLVLEHAAREVVEVLERFRTPAPDPADITVR